MTPFLLGFCDELTKHAFTIGGMVQGLHNMNNDALARPEELSRERVPTHDQIHRGRRPVTPPPARPAPQQQKPQKPVSTAGAKKPMPAATAAQPAQASIGKPTAGQQIAGLPAMAALRTRESA